MSSTPHVALIIETSSVYGQRLLEGIGRYLRSHHPWSVFLDQSDLFAAPPTWLTDWDGDGIITRAQRSASLFERLSVPVIDLSDVNPASSKMTRIESDQRAIGSIGAKHLMERGLSSFAFCGFSDHHWSVERLAGFQKALAPRGFEADVYQSTWSGKRDRSWEHEQERIARWLTRLPVPTGVMAANDLRGQHVLDACARAELSVPEGIAVVGCDNEELLCELSRPALSSVLPDAARIGYKAAQLLDEKMRGQSNGPVEHILVPPLRVLTRQSSEGLAVSDPLVADALRFIRERACFGAQVIDVVRELGVGRTTLERKFRKQLGQPPHVALRSMRLKRVKQLLRETDLPLDRIARLAGFKHPEYMSVVFKREEGATPGNYRRTRD